MIIVENLTKSFGPKLVVDNVSLCVQKGEVLGFLGPNGAGKSTSMRMITGYLPPSDGKVTVCGFDVLDQPLRSKSRIGYLPENAPIYGDMSVLGFLSFCAELRNLFGTAKKEAIENVVQLCFLQPVLHQSVDTLSKGYRHRTCLAQALIHDPEVLVMDEPTDGLDPNQKHEVRMLIKEMGNTKAIIFSTHILEEVEAACTRALIIDQGKIVANGTPAQLKSRAPVAGSLVVGVRALTWKTAQRQFAAMRCLERSELIDDADSVLSVRLFPKGPGSAEAAGTTASAGLLPELLDLAHRQRWEVQHVSVDEGRLDDVFRSLTMADTATRT